jgi:hypothetical protein
MGLDAFRTDSSSKNSEDNKSNKQTSSKKDNNDINKNESSKLAKNNEKSYKPSNWLHDKYDSLNFTKKNRRCKQCGKLFSRLSSHYNQSNTCSFPGIANSDMELLTGMIMSDGSLNRQSKNPSLKWNMTNLPFMLWLKEKLNIHIYGPYFSLSAKGSHQAALRSDGGFKPTKWENYKDVYTSQTYCHPSLSTLNWYSDGGKEFPRELELTDNILKIWYCGDGNIDKRKLKITASNESKRMDNIKQMFSSYGISLDRIDKTKQKADICLNKNKSKKMLDRIRPVVPGFEYKWCTGSQRQYKLLKELSTYTSKTPEQAKYKLNKFSLDEHKERALNIGGFGGYS